jgi:GNAT superfamily N-acetyltransferase
MLGLEIRTSALDAPEALALNEALQQEYVVRYGGRDRTPVDPEEFTPPLGAFRLAWLDGRAVACGGVRVIEPGLAEIKRMYVEPDARGRGIARALLAELEAEAVRLGCTRVRLETGTRQPEAMALYESVGYQPMPSYGIHQDSPCNRCYSRALV